MKKKLSAFFLLAGMLIPACSSVFAEDNNVKKGEEIIMSGFNIKDSVISRMIDQDWAVIDSLHCGNLVIPREINKIPLNSFTANSLIVCKKLHDAGYKAYIVGGAIRDMITGVKPDDADITTDANINELKAVFGDSLKTHQAGDATYCMVFLNHDMVDVASFSACPQRYIDLGLVKPFPPKSLLADSYERDLPFNALYYDPFSGDLIDFHGGLKDLRDHTIHNILDPELEFTTNPGSPIIRLLRFYAKYGYTLDEKIDSVLRVDARRIQAMCAPNSLYSNSARMFYNGYSLKCYNLLEKYKIFDMVYPCTKIIKNQKAYKAWLTNKLEENDSLINNGKKLSRAYCVACVIYPAYKQLRTKLSAEEAAKQIVDMQEKVMEFWENKKVCQSLEKMYLKETKKTDKDKNAENTKDKKENKDDSKK